MSVKNRIMIAIVPLIVLSVILSNLAFWFFTRSYIDRQENTQVQIASESVSTFIAERESDFLGTVNDWAHWDDTYNYLTGKNPDYVDINLIKSTYDNLNLGFLILIDSSGHIAYQQYFSLEQQSFLPFPDDFTNALPELFSYCSQQSDIASLRQIGEGYYLLASSEVFDSISVKPPVGRMIIGRLLDKPVIATIESSSGATVSALRTISEPDIPHKTDLPANASMTVEKSKETINIALGIPDPYAETSAIQFDLSLSRDIYQTSIRQLLNFTVINTLTVTAIAVVLIILSGNALAKPFFQLVQEVRHIDTDRGNYKRISIYKGKEFTLLSKSINLLLSRIESAQQELSDSKKKLEATLISVGDAVFAVDVEQRIVFMNPVAEQLTGWTYDEAKGLPVSRVFRIINEFTRDPVPSPIENVFERHEIVQLANHTLLVAKDGTELPIEDTAAPILDEDGAVSGCVLVFRDSSERKERQKRIEYLSYHDQLTELYNRRFFEEELRRLDVERNLPLSIIYADVNGLKVVNDAFGHEFGDRLLTLVADAMKATCRADDIIARIGGDEFLILLPQTDREQAEGIIDRIKERLGVVRINGISASVSLGLDTKTDATQLTSDAMNRAEQHMYQRKISETGGNRSIPVREVFEALLQKSIAEQAHASRVSKLCTHLGKAFGLNAVEIRELGIAGELHDIGKVILSDSLLKKDAPLTDAEWQQVRKHPETGYRLLGTCSEYVSVAEIVLAHHERIDGTGYPMRLKGEEIGLRARILAVAEAFDAMTHDQPFRAALTRAEAFAELRRNAGTQFDAAVVETFITEVAKELPEDF
jgi:diguanylate cyclase (GGDEF)-like protein/PAS domain S-box-containing protein